MGMKIKGQTTHWKQVGDCIGRTGHRLSRVSLERLPTVGGDGMCVPSAQAEKHFEMDSVKWALEHDEQAWGPSSGMQLVLDYYYSLASGSHL